MAKDIKKAVLAILFISAAAIPYNLPPEIKDPYEQPLFNWLVGFFIVWAVAILVLFIACKFGPELTYDRSAPLGQIIHWKHFPNNWREMLFVTIFFSGIGLFMLFIAYTSAYGEASG